MKWLNFVSFKTIQRMLDHSLLCTHRIADFFFMVCIMTVLCCAQLVFAWIVSTAAIAVVWYFKLLFIVFLSPMLAALASFKFGFSVLPLILLTHVTTVLPLLFFMCLLVACFLDKSLASAKTINTFLYFLIKSWRSSGTIFVKILCCLIRARNCLKWVFTRVTAIIKYSITLNYLSRMAFVFGFVRCIKNFYAKIRCAVINVLRFFFDGYYSIVRNSGVLTYLFWGDTLDMQLLRLLRCLFSKRCNTKTKLHIIFLFIVAYCILMLWFLLWMLIFIIFCSMFIFIF